MYVVDIGKWANQTRKLMLRRKRNEKNKGRMKYGFAEGKRFECLTEL